MSDAYWFDAARAARAVEFFPRFLRFTTGEWAGRPFHLTEAQAHHIGQIFGWRRRETGMRRYRRVRWWEARKNGKTELAAGVGLLLMVADGEPGGQVFSLAATGDQAGIVFGRAARMVQMSDELSRLVEVTAKGMFCPGLMSNWLPLSGMPRGKHGLSAHGSIGDEAHEWPDDRLHTFVAQSMGARRQPLDFIISTAGERKGYGWELWNTSCKIRDGVIDDPETYVVIYAAEPEDDWRDPKTWAKANPNLGISPKRDWFEDQFKQALESPRLENHFKRYHLNLWTEQTTRWLPMDHWRQCTGEAADLERWRGFEDRLRKRRCFAGLDLASVRDTTALVYFFPATASEPPAVLCRFWVPEDNVAARCRRDRVPYDAWIKSGAMMATPGNVTDYGAIRAQLKKDAEIYEIVAVGADRWNSSQLILDLKEDGCNIFPFGQGYQSMSTPAKELERLVLAHGFDHGGHPVLAWMAANVATAEDAAGNIKPDKENSHEKIDGIVSLVMAIGCALGAPKPVEPAIVLL